MPIRRQFKSEGQCALCLQHKKLKKSHILSEYLYRPLYNSKHKLLGIKRTASGLRADREQLGIRESLLCGSCEQHLNTRYEQPSCEVWNTITQLHERPARGLTRRWYPNKKAVVERDRKTGRGRALLVRGVDYDSFKLFIISLLWRMHASALPEFSGVSLSSAGVELREMLITSDARGPTDYPFVMMLYRPPLRLMSFRPAKIEIDGHPVLRFDLASISIWYFLTTDTRSSMRALFFDPEGELRLTVADPKKTTDWEGLRSIASEVQVPDRWLSDG